MYFAKFVLLIFLVVQILAEYTTENIVEEVEGETFNTTESTDEQYNDVTTLTPEVSQLDVKEEEEEDNRVNVFPSEQRIHYGSHFEKLLKLNQPHELDTWVAPRDIQKTYQYYHSGYDYDGRPIWVGEVGRWDHLLATQKDKLQDLYKYVEQGFRNIFKSIQERNTPEHPVNDIKVIVDLEGLSLIQIAHIPTITLVMDLIRKYRILALEHFHTILVVNTNAIAHTGINILRPIMGSLMERVHIYGTNQKQWIPYMLKECPKDQIPVWYGGKKNFKPVQIYG